jgi:hypothetical protein
VTFNLGGIQESDIQESDIQESDIQLGDIQSGDIQWGDIMPLYQSIPGSSSPRDQPIWYNIPIDQNRLRDYPNIPEDFVVNGLGLPVGTPVPTWTPPPFPPTDPMVGVACRVERLAGRHLDDLWCRLDESSLLPRIF